MRLLAVLRRVREDEEIRDRVALKGGTALNVFWLSLPRLSVDIDLNFVGELSARELAEQRPEFEQRVARACRLAGCRVAHSPSEHAGGKFRLRFTSLLGGEQNLELDISFVARVPLGELVERAAVLPGFEQERALTYTLPELAAGKFTALLARVAARDQYDAVRILDHDPAILDTPEFRLAFTCFAAAAREDARGWSGQLLALDPQDVRTRLVPVLRAAQEPLAGDAKKLPRMLLTNRLELQRRIAAQPMLRWKQMNVRQHLGLPPMPDVTD
ncbi:MAG: nucleotidyl transferase AbiEii/AbiGii toxin family protein [Candidatus Eisenbacteria bacterium]|nr:nucleotidyl transferase AbiEii/AbiGii toxin family protein [Candidatus Eisenbacteria bacterium]